MNTPYHKNPGEGGHNINNFGKPFLGYFYHILPLADLSPGAERRFILEIMHFHCMTYIATSSPRTPTPGVINFKILLDPFLFISTIF